MRKLLYVLLASLGLAIPLIAIAQSPSSPNFWKVVGNARVTPLQSYWSVQLPTMAADPSGVNGMMLFNSNTGTFRCFEGTWKNCIGGAASSTGITTLNGQTGATQSFATSTTATGLVLNITSATNVHTWALSLASGYGIPLTASSTEWASTRNIVSASSTKWDTAYTWGNHATAGYLTGSYASSTFVSFPYASSTFSTFSYSSSTFPSFTYATNTFPSFAYASSTFPRFAYASSTFPSFAYASNTFQTILTTGNLTASAPLQFDNTRQVIGGTAALSLAAGYTIPLSASTTEWATARNIVTASSTKWDTAYTWGNHATAGYALAANLPSTITCTGSQKISAYDSSTHTFTCSTDQTGGGGGSTTTITSNVTVNGPDFTFATSSVTGLNLNITGSGSTVTFSPQLQSGYNIPLTASTTQWADFYNTPSTRITVAGNLSWQDNLLTVSTGFTIPRTASTTEWATARNIVTASSTLWDTAYTWGNHAGLYPTFAYASSTFPSFSYGTSTYATIANYPTYTYASSTYALASNFSGTNGKVARWTAASAVSTGILLDNGTVAGVNATSSTVSFNVQGSGSNAAFNVASSTGTSLFQITATAQILACTTCRLTIPQGTAPTLSAAGDIAVDTTNGQFIYYGTMENVIQATSTKAITWESPTASDNITIFRADAPITITKASCIQTSSVNNPSTTVNIRHFTDRSTTTGNTLLASNTACTATTTTQSLTIDGDATVAAGEWVWVITSATSNSSSTNITLEFKYDRQ